VRKYKILIILGIVIIIFEFWIFLKKITSQPTVENSLIELANTEDNTIAKEILAKCSKNESSEVNKETCYSIKFKDIAKINGFESAFKILDQLQTIDPQAKGCHLIAHGIGAGAFENDPAGWQSLIKTLPASCSYGAIHGVIEGYVGTLPNKRLTKDIVRKICGENPRADCNHIIGHLVLVETKGNVDKAIDMCQVFTEPRQRQFCLTGVFMEQQTAINLIEHGYAPKSWLDWSSRFDELEKLCRKYDGENAIACWEEIIHVALVKFRNDPKTLFDFCSTSQILEGAKKCKRHGIGVIVAGVDYNLEKTKYMCALKQPEDESFERDCYIYTVGATLASIPKSGGPKTINFCSSLEPKFQESCFGEIGQMLKESGSLSQNEHAKICENAESKFTNLCLYGHAGDSSSSKRYNQD